VTARLLLLKPEVETAIKQMKNEKAVGPDNIETEFLRLLDEEAITWIREI